MKTQLQMFELKDEVQQHFVSAYEGRSYTTHSARLYSLYHWRGYMHLNLKPYDVSLDVIPNGVIVRSSYFGYKEIEFDRKARERKGANCPYYIGHMVGDRQTEWVMWCLLYDVNLLFTVPRRIR